MSSLSGLMTRFRDWQFDRFYRAAVEHKMSEIQQGRMPILEESGGNLPEIRSGKSNGYRGFLEHKAADRKLIDMVLEKRSAKVGATAGVTMLRSPYNYENIDRFFRKESYFARSTSRQFETMVRNGYGVVTDNLAIRKRLMMELTRIQAMNFNMLDQLFARAYTDLSKYSICIIHKVREKKSTKDINGEDVEAGRIKKFEIIKPHNVVAYFNADGDFIGISEYRFLSGARPSARFGFRTSYTLNSTQVPDYPAEDIIILRTYQEDDDFFPEPQSNQMLDDILTLRSLEETVELYVFQYGSPILHAQVGTEEDPASDADIARVHGELESMASNGMIVTNHKVKLDVKSLMTDIANLMPYIDHFKTRVLVGSGSSSISVGEGSTANRSTAESIDDALADHCSYMANILANGFNYNIIPDILTYLGTGGNEFFEENGDLAIRIEFNEARLEKQIARENSALTQYQANMITSSEMRKMIKRAPLTKEQEKGLYLNTVQIPLAEAQAEAKANNALPGSGTAAKVGSQLAPTNQHGKKAGPGSKKN